MSRSATEKRAAFRALHESGCFVLPNPWDVGSAKILEHLGYKALASTSAGMAWALGSGDGQVSLDEVLLHLSTLAHASDLPLNADFENGFADAPAEVAANVALAVDTGIAGLSIEDYTGRAADGLYGFDLAVARVAAARAAIDRSGSGVLLTARSEGFIRGAPDMDETLRRLSTPSRPQAPIACMRQAFRDEAQIRTVVEADAPKPVNLLSPGLPLATSPALGERRISLAGAVAGRGVRRTATRRQGHRRARNLRLARPGCLRTDAKPHLRWRLTPFSRP